MIDINLKNYIEERVKRRLASKMFKKINFKLNLSMFLSSIIILLLLHCSDIRAAEFYKYHGYEMMKEDTHAKDCVQNHATLLEFLCVTTPNEDPVADYIKATLVQFLTAVRIGIAGTVKQKGFISALDVAEIQEVSLKLCLSHLRRTKKSLSTAPKEEFHNLQIH